MRERPLQRQLTIQNLKNEVNKTTDIEELKKITIDLIDLFENTKDMLADELAKNL